MSDQVPAGVDVLRYGFDADADVRATDIESLGERGMSFRLVTDLGESDVTTPALGRHSVHNALAGAAAGLVAGMSLDEVAAALERPFAAPHRTTLIDAGEWRILDDTYNAAPDSMRAALDLLASLPGRHVAVLGEMLELGRESDAAHRDVGAYAARTAEVLVAVGRPARIYADAAEDAGLNADAVHVAPDRDAALAILKEILRPTDVVLLKASNGERFFELVDELRELASGQPVA
jgi:UDP-N-acetylmuramoyl-tripeptide--D-alanyl-D-alanine ligase